MTYLITINFYQKESGDVTVGHLFVSHVITYWLLTVDQDWLEALLIKCPSWLYYKRMLSPTEKFLCDLNVYVFLGICTQ